MPSSAMANIASDSGRQGESKILHTRLLPRPLRRDNLEGKAEVGKGRNPRKAGVQSRTHARINKHTHTHKHAQAFFTVFLSVCAFIGMSARAQTAWWRSAP